MRVGNKNPNRRAKRICVSEAKGNKCAHAHHVLKCGGGVGGFPNTLRFRYEYLFFVFCFFMFKYMISYRGRSFWLEMEGVAWRERECVCCQWVNIRVSGTWKFRL